MKFFTSALAIALASVAFAVPAHADASNWSVVGVWGGSSDVTVQHGQGGKNGGMLTLVDNSDKVSVVGIQANGSKGHLQGTAVIGSGQVNVITFQDGKNNLALTGVVDSSKVNVTTVQENKNNIAASVVMGSDKTDIYTEQMSDGNLSAVGVFGSSNVDVTVVQGTLASAPAPQ